MKVKRIFFYFLLIFPLPGWPQVNTIKNISGLPTAEIYDLMVDSKGFLWIAHDLGITRFDGVNFVSYSNPEQSSLSTSDLIEDKYGRIWFHNFTGQIFYIENQKMVLLRAYDAKKETAFPRIGLFKNNLVATSAQGLFICNTANLSCKYITCPNAPNKGTTSLAILNNAVIGYDDGNWFIYRQGALLKKALFKENTETYINGNASTLNTATFKDTAFMFSNPSGILNKIVIDKDSLRLIKKIHTGDFINTLTIDSEKVWVNTIHKSFLLNNFKRQLNGYNITAIVHDKEGNTWYSSLKNGLMVKYKILPGSLLPVNIIRNDDVIKCMALNGPVILLGTQNGNLITYDTNQKKITRQIALPGNRGGISYLYHTEGNKYLVGTSVNTYDVDIVKGGVNSYPNIKTLKQASKTKQFLLLASARGLMIIPSNTSADLKRQIARQFKGLVYRHDANGDYFEYAMRCRAVCYNPLDSSTFVAFKDGLYVINKKGIKPFLYNNLTVYATCLKYVNGNVIIATINNGLLLTNGSQTRHITANDGLLSTTILKIKQTGDLIWLFGAGTTNVLDTTDLKIVNSLDLSSLTKKQVLAVEQIGSKAYVATPDGLYILAITSPAEKFTYKNYLQKVLINNKPLPFDTAHSFSYFENNIQFNLTVPLYYHANDIYFKYILNGANNPSWQVTDPGDRAIAFSELSPGKYSFKAYAVHPQFGMADSMVRYDFSIAEKWWQTWVFKIIIWVFIAVMVAYIVSNYLLNRFRIQKALYEQQLTIQNERHRISSEMHDDVGAGLSAIKLFLNMTENNTAPHNLPHINEMVSDMAEKINQIIWSTDTENDTLEILLTYIQYQTSKLFEHTNIKYQVTLPANIPHYVITSAKRRNIYLVTKEFLHNALKHANASVISLHIAIEKNELLIKINDNGIGFNHLSNHTKGMGMKNIKTRIAELNGKMQIESNSSGTLIILKIGIS